MGKLHDLGFGNDFLDMLKTQATKAKANMWNYIGLKNLCASKSEKTTMGENICKSCPIRGKYPECIENSYNLNLKFESLNNISSEKTYKCLVSTWKDTPAPTTNH